MRWNILIEDANDPGHFIDAGLPVWSDGFAPDGSDWGDDESNFITDHLLALSAANNGISYAASWNGDTSPNDALAKAAATAAKKLPKKVPTLIVAPPAKRKHHGHK